MGKPVVAIVGRPNVGKSTIFNRIAGERISIVEDTPGVTRDRIYSSAEWLNHDFNLIDTGGIEVGDEPFLAQIRHQAEIAMEEADVIIFMTNGREGVTAADEEVAKILYRTKKPVVLAVNKVDNPEMRANIYDFMPSALASRTRFQGRTASVSAICLTRSANILKTYPKRSMRMRSFNLPHRPAERRKILSCKRHAWRRARDRQQYCGNNARRH